VLGALLAVLWLFVRGVELTPTRVAEEFLIGLLVGVPIAFAVRRFYTPGLDLGRAVRVAPYAALYVLAFLKELVTANVDVAYRVLAPSMPIYPRVIELPLRVESAPAITTIANSITLTPGTLTMDYDADANSLYVHSIDGRDVAAVVEPIRAGEDYALVIFPEERLPRDEAPPATVATETPDVTRGSPPETVSEPGPDDEDGGEDGGR
jgi:multicomponent Na+:H+ antiporter subunit E